MPTALRYGPYRFFFYSNEGKEPPHVHVDSDGKLGKVWLAPISVANQGRFSNKEIGAIVGIVQAHQQILLEAWNDHFN